MDKDKVSLEFYTHILQEIQDQPDWRETADKEMDYADGNQLGSELLQKQKQLGIPPACENIIGPALRAIAGHEAATRTDWRVTPDGDIDGQDIADALNYKLNQAETMSRADRALSEGFHTQIGVGIGWVEVSRESDPFKFPYRCMAVHRNEIHWDMRSSTSDLSDARWLMRSRWLLPDRLKQVFPQHKELIDTIGKHGAQWIESYALDDIGGASTGLRNAWDTARSWTISEDRWYNPNNKELCLNELWYRRWETVSFVVLGNGRVVEYDPDNPKHIMALASGVAQVQKATVARVRRAFWLGPHLLDDAPSPYPHRHFPYVPMFGFKEDNTGVYYGYIRDMIYQQDSLNSGISKLRWGLAAVRTERTKGAVLMSDAQHRQQVARVDADIVLDPNEMAKQGARYDVKRDFQLSNQHFQMMQDNREAIARVSPVTPGFAGKTGTATSGLQEKTQVEQSTKALGRIMDNFRAARQQVGELLLALIVEDIGDKPTTVVIEGDAVTADRTVQLNQLERDADTGLPYLSNDIQRIRLKVALEDVPATSSYREQQLAAMSEAVKSLPAQYQAAAMPFLAALMDVPFKRDLVEALRNASEQKTPEQIEQQVQEAVKQALVQSGNELKSRELDLKAAESDAKVQKLMAEAVRIGVQAAYSSMQAAGQITMNPQIAPIADVVMQGAGYQRPNPMGDDPNYPQPTAVDAPVQDVPDTPNSNTSPEFPPVPEQPQTGMQGIETSELSDNMQA